jgi:hypothetical protein
VSVPKQPKIYHIVHIDRIPSILAAGCLWCDAEIVRREPKGTTIGMNNIKQRRLKVLKLASHPGLHVGDCVPFYFCPRSIMLYLIHQGNHPDLEYRGGQDPIVHLEADFHASVAWAAENNKRWAFTLSNAGANYFEDRLDIVSLKEINWEAVGSERWGGQGVPSSIKEGKQAEFLMEASFPWSLIERIGVLRPEYCAQLVNSLQAYSHRPPVEIKPTWYYG